MSQTEKRRFWTAGRAGFAAAVFAATALAVSSCTADDVARDAQTAATPAANKPSVTITSRPGGQQPQQQAPADRFSPAVLAAKLQGLDGGDFTLGDYEGKTVVLDIWATWCGPCRKEVPHLVEIQKEYQNAGVEVVGLTLENPVTDEEKVRAFAKEFKINYKVGWVPSHVAMEIMRGNGSIPQTFVIAPGGRILAHYRGYSDKVPEMIRAALEKARAGQASGD